MRAGLTTDWAGADWDMRRWPDFRTAELACKCGGRFCAGEYFHDPAFVDALQRLRDALGAPVIINSGHRCALWNAHVGGAPQSEHKRIAADVRLAGHAPGALLRGAAGAGFSTFGFYRSFLHMDLRPGRRWFGGAAARRFWTPIIEREDMAWWR